MRPELPFDTLLEIATRERDRSARRLAEAHEAGCKARERLRMLEAHLAKCTQANPATVRTVDGAQIRNAGAFIAKLETAIERQAAEVRMVEARGAAAQSALTAAERRLRAFGQLQQRCVAARAQLERSRDQHQMDEFAARRAREAG